jgi:FkbM family methyltransferase
MFLYHLVDKFLMRDLSDELINKLNSKKPIIFDVGCFIGNFSRNLKKKLDLKNKNFYLFDANPNLKIKDFKYNNLVFSDKIQERNFYLNEFFPSSGSSLKVDTKNDVKWNCSRKLITSFLNARSGWVGGGFKTLKVKTDTIDNFCKNNKVKKIDILKIDVEGSEFEVLKGSKKILNKTHLIQLEIYQNRKNFTKIEKKITTFLKKYNFKKVKEKKIWSVSLFSNLIGKDVLFVKS